MWVGKVGLCCSNDRGLAGPVDITFWRCSNLGKGAESSLKNSLCCKEALVQVPNHQHSQHQ